MKRGRTMTMIRVAISDATLKWVDEIRKDIEELTGHRPPPRASVLSGLCAKMTGAGMPTLSTKASQRLDGGYER